MYLKPPNGGSTGGQGAGLSTFPGLETQTQEDKSFTSWGHINF